MKHGRYTTYRNHGCRCDDCRAAWNAWFRDYNHRTGRHAPMDEHLARVRANPPAHGTESRYTSRHAPCRCAECREAARVARAKRRGQPV